jgi:hypothetical protein
MNHPAGRIGKRLVMKVADIMKTEKNVSKATPEDNGLAALTSLSGNPSSGGAVMVVDADGTLLGEQTHSCKLPHRSVRESAPQWSGLLYQESHIVSWQKKEKR